MAEVSLYKAVRLCIINTNSNDIQPGKRKSKGCSYISENNANTLYNFIIKHKIANVLELGIAHGTASCYIAAALDEIGKGKVTCVDLLEKRDYFNPSIEQQISQLNLDRYVDIHRMESGYNWFYIMK